MKRILSFVLIAALFLVSCGTKEVRKVSEDSRVATEAFALIDKVRIAYSEKDLTTLERNSTKDGYRAITGGMKGFDSVAFTFNPALVEIVGSSVQVNVSWKGAWKRAGKVSERRGMAVFILKDKPYKLDGVMRANPFVTPE